MMMKLEYVDVLSGGRKRFRRRYPKAVAQVLAEEFFQVSMAARGFEVVPPFRTVLQRF